MTEPLPPTVDEVKATSRAKMNDQQKVAALRKALADLVADLEDRAKWMIFEPDDDGKTVPCGNGVYMRAKQALSSTN